MKFDKVVISRILVGSLFIISGLIKANDPLGFSYKLEEYFAPDVLNWSIFIGTEVWMAALISIGEIVLGAALIAGEKSKLVAWSLLIMMVFFTFLTGYTAIGNWFFEHFERDFTHTIEGIFGFAAREIHYFKDCGCFGDALIISNWQTLYKNLVINALVIVLALRAADFKVGMAAKSQFIVFLTIVLSFLGFEYYNIQHLPVVDFRPWKVGNHLLPENPKPIKYYLTYKNTKTGETKEYLSKDLPWQDSVFMADWKWLNSREEDPNFQEKRTFPMVDNEGNDWSNDIVQYDGGVLLITIYDIQKISQEQADKIKVLYQDALKAELNIIMLNSNTTDVYNEFSERFGLPDMDVYNSDDTALKAAIRSNPGLIVVKNAKVIAKYHINDFSKY